MTFWSDNVSVGNEIGVFDLNSVNYGGYLDYIGYASNFTPQLNCDINYSYSPTILFLIGELM